MACFPDWTVGGWRCRPKADQRSALTETGNHASKTSGNQGMLHPTCVHITVFREKRRCFAVYVLTLVFDYNSLCQGSEAQQTENTRAQIPADGEVLQCLETQSADQGRGEGGGDWERGMRFIYFVNEITV